MKKVLFIYNPNAGKGKILHHLNEIRAVFEDEGDEITLYKTKAPLDGKREIIEHAHMYDLIVCAGGDGTLSETVSAMMALKEEDRKTIGYIPTGSTNDTGKSFGLPRDILDDAKVAAKGVAFSTDVGTLNGMYFTYVASFGKLSAVSCFTPQDLKRKFGHAAYISEGIKALLNLESYDMTVAYEDAEGTVHEEEGDYYLGMVTNSFSVGGFRGITGKSVNLQDGLFEVILLKRPKNLVDFAKQVGDILIAPDKDKSTVEVRKFKAKNICFSSKNDVQWVIDGEDGGKHKVVNIDNRRKAVQIMVEKV